MSKCELTRQVVKRRVDKVSNPREGGRPEIGKRKAIEAEDSEEEGEPTKKKTKFDGKKGDKKKGGKGGKRDRKDDKNGEEKSDKSDKPTKAEASSGEPEKRGLEKLGAHLGGLIGRKRKARKGGK